MPTFVETGFTVSPQANTASPAAFVGFDGSLGYRDLLWEMLPKNAALGESQSFPTWYESGGGCVFPKRNESKR
jgi:hypothetical protein